MNGWRRGLVVALTALALPLAAWAQSPADAVVTQLRAQGFTEFQVSRTLLGRVQVIAVGADGRREIVFNPTTGEILRDYFEAGGGVRTPRIIDRDDRSDRNDDDRRGGGGGNGGGGNGGGGGEGGGRGGGGDGGGNGGGGDDDDGGRDHDDDDDDDEGGGDD